MRILRSYLEAARVPTPVTRRLRAFAFDPSLGAQIESASFNDITIEVAWEPLKRGPIGEYLEVVDVDPASGACYHPVDLEHAHLLAQDGLAPSESNPQFHQQMVYAVAMTTIGHFERALGRVVLWADHRTKGDGGYVEQFVRRLRIYPHALRDRNAYYSPEKKALLFGYFPVTRKDRFNTPGTLVFTCLSHDIVAHETTHALLDGVHPRFSEPTNLDVRAFHEAFADIVALFQHFSYPTVLESQIRRTRGNLNGEHLLGQLAQQFGQATGRGAALREYLGRRNDTTGAWEPLAPDPQVLDSVIAPHARGAVLVAAVFRAFLKIYRARTADLYRIATQGTGTLPEGEIHPDLTARLAAEAARCADRVLQMCIRAIDYCPPVDITFGAFLRGIITADIETAPDERLSFRLVFVESFREWGIFPQEVSSVGADALAWPSGAELVRQAIADQRMHLTAEELVTGMKHFVQDAARNWTVSTDRFEVWQESERVKKALWQWLRDGDSLGRDYARLFGLVIDERDAPATVSRGREGLAVEIHSVRPAIRRGPLDRTTADLVIEVTQRRDGYFDPAVQRAMDARPAGTPAPVPPDFRYRAGATVIVDPATSEVRRVIRTRGTVVDDDELGRVRRFLQGGSPGRDNAFDGVLEESIGRRSLLRRDEPFALLHDSAEVR